MNPKCRESIFSRRALLFAAVGGMCLSGCGKSESGRVEGKVYAVATTTMVADMVARVGGEHVEVKGLMRPGVDPHLYEPVPGDGIALREADLVFYSGLFLEGQMHDKLEGLGEKSYAVTEAIGKGELLVPGEAGGHPDPHVWGDASLWARCVPGVAEALAKTDPAHKAEFEANAAAYVAELEALHAWALERAAELPESARVLITSHDAFSYFGRAYGFEVIGLQGISTVGESGLADRVKMVDLIKERGVKAIFVESSVSHAAIESISKDSGAKIGGELFSDALGQPGEIEEMGGENYDQGTYIGMLKHNMNAAVEALK
jgi:manganese/zinc/iron transport system substrate-binding protein